MHRLYISDILLLLFLFFSPIFWEVAGGEVFSQGTWVPISNYTDTIENGVGLSIGSKGYVGLGNNANGNRKDFWEYSPAGNTWTQKADFAGAARIKSTGFGIGNFGYVGLGFGYNDFYRYDPSGNSWTALASYPGSGRYTTVSFVIQGKGYVGTGANITLTETVYKDFWEYDPGTNAWTKKTDLGGVKRRHAMAFAIGCRGYIGCGWDQSAFSWYKDVWEYVPATNTWTQKADFPFTTEGGSGFSIGNKGYIGLGESSSGFHNEFYEYNPSANIWTAIPAFPGGARHRVATFVIDSAAFVGTGGGSGGLTKDFYKYVPNNYAPPGPCCLISLDSSSTNATCGNANGTATVTPSNGSTPYSYLWTNSQTTQTATGLVAGTYKATVTDAGGSCSDTISVTVSATNFPLALITPSSITICTGGSAVLTASGGTTYSWSTGATTSAITVNPASTTTYIVTATNTCGSDTEQVTVNVGGGNLSVTPGSTAASCGNCNGTATATVAGGSGNYTYNWSNGKTTSTATGLCAGNYIVTVGDAGSGGSTVVFYTEDFTSGGTGWTLNQNGTGTNGNVNNFWIINSLANCGCGTGNYLHITCNQSDALGFCNASTGGVAGCYYNAGPAFFGDNPSTDKIAVSPNISTVGKTTITLKFQWRSNGEAGDDFGKLRLSNDGGATWTELAKSYSSATACGQDSVVLSSIYENITNFKIAFRWVNSANGNGNDPPFGIDDIELSVPAGGGSCVSTAAITVNSTSSVTTSTSSTNATCGLSNGTAAAAAAGGSTPYTYAWSNGKTTSSITGLAAGSYSVTVTDANSCTVIASAAVSQTSAPAVTASSTNANCGSNNGSATVTATGGSSPYTYSWSNGKTISSITGLTAGTYNVTVTDVNSCSVVATVAVSQTSAPTVTASSTNASCGANNGTATAVAAGGSSPYSYLWSNVSTVSTVTGLNAGIYTVTVKDANNCTATATVNVLNSNAPTATTSSTNASCNTNNGTAATAATGGGPPYSYLWSNGKTTSSITGLAAGNYTITITDANSCSVVASAVVSQPSPPSLTTSTTATGCGTSTGTAAAAAAGGSSPYTYLWSDGSTTQTASGLSAGNWTVTITDAANCKDSATVTIGTSAPPAVTASSTNASCGVSNGTAAAAATGGSTPYTYLWSNGSTTTTATGLDAGNYTITVKDAANCTATAMVTVSNPNAPSATTSSSTASCNTNNGSVSLTVSGGVTPYSYSWSNGQTGATATGLAVGNYVVTVTDSAGCSTTATATVTNVVPVTSATSSNPNCYGDSNGSATLTASGGSSPYSYLWNDSAATTTATATGLKAGAYSVTVTDSAGCKSIQNITISNPLKLISSISNDTTLCENTSTTLSVTASVPAKYTWSNGSSSSTSGNVIPSSDSTFYVTVTKPDGSCPEIDSVKVSAIKTSASITGDTAVCARMQGSLTASGGSKYNWNTNDTSKTIIVTPPASTSYSVTVTTTCGPRLASSVMQVLSPPVASAGTDTSIQSEGSIKLTATGGTSYLWSTGATTNSISVSPVTTTVYTVTVTDAQGCTNVSKVTVSIDDSKCTIFIPTIFTPNGDGKNDMLFVRGLGIKELNLKIFDRWGEKVFETTDMSKGWDGKINNGEANSAAFVYILDAVCVNGEVKSDKGNISMVK